MHHRPVARPQPPGAPAAPAATCQPAAARCGSGAGVREEGI